MLIYWNTGDLKPIKIKKNLRFSNPKLVLKIFLVLDFSSILIILSYQLIQLKNKN